MKIAVYGDGIFFGYKADTFWGLTKTFGKQHDAIHPHLISNLLFKLNHTPKKKEDAKDIMEGLLFISKNELIDCNEIILKLQNESEEVVETKRLFKNTLSEWVEEEQV